MQGCGGGGLARMRRNRIRKKRPNAAAPNAPTPAASAAIVALSANTLGGAISTIGLSALPCGDGTTIAHCMGPTARGTHFTTDAFQAVKIEWNSWGGSYSNALPVFERDVSNFNTLQFRVTVDFLDDDNLADEPQDFTIRIVDVAGRSASIKASDYADVGHSHGGVLYYPPGSGTAGHKAAVLNTLRVPLNAFLALDMTNIATVDLVFDQKQKGRIFVSDLAFADEGMSTAESWLVSGGAL